MNAHAVIETAHHANLEPSSPAVHERKLDDHQRIDDELLDPWFHLGDSPPDPSEHDDDIYQAYPVHPFWRLAFWRLLFWI
jgi:hypothetical protein